MPDRQIHAKHCKKLYGYGFNEIHAWMDGTVRSKGIKHRMDRHDPYRTPDKAYEIFKNKVPPQYRKFIKDAVKDHIELDERRGVSQEKKNLFLKERKERPIGIDSYEKWEEEMLEGIDFSAEEKQEKRCYLLGEMISQIEEWDDMGYRRLFEKFVRNRKTGKKMSFEEFLEDWKRAHRELGESLDENGNKKMSKKSWEYAKKSFSKFIETINDVNSSILELENKLEREIYPFKWPEHLEDEVRRLLEKCKEFKRCLKNGEFNKAHRLFKIVRDKYENLIEKKFSLVREICKEWEKQEK